MQKQIDFAIPGLYEFFDINKKFINIKKQYPECFYNNINIAAIYGNFQYCLWEGGRSFKKFQCTPLEEILEIQNFYNEENNIPMRFVYTNSQLNNNDLSNKFCNIITDICQNQINEIVVNSSILENYIREYYPKYKIISSTTKCLNNINLAINELNKNYYRICLDYNLNSEDNLQQIPKDLQNKCELLINESCPLHCNYRKFHYDLISKAIIDYDTSYLFAPCINPDHINKQNNIAYDINKTQLSKLLDIANNYNIIHFKLQGRAQTKSYHTINLIKYFVKPEYQLFITFQMMQNN